MTCGALGLELLPLRVLIRRQDRGDLRLVGGADLPHLHALPVDRRLERVDLGGVSGLLGLEELLHRGMGLLEERLVLFARRLPDDDRQPRHGRGPTATGAATRRTAAPWRSSFYRSMPRRLR